MSIISKNLQIARYYYNTQQLNLIPIVYGEKSPSISWGDYVTRRSTEDEIEQWFNHSNPINFGAVHGQFDSLPYAIALDIDHDPDQNFFNRLKSSFPELCNGWIERSGSGEGLHIPLWLGHAPQTDSGRIVYRFDNVTDLDIRIHSCQTVLPPSKHPSGGFYKYIQKGAIGETKTLDSLISWCNDNGKFIETKPKTSSYFKLDKFNLPGTLAHAVLQVWDDCLKVFKHFGHDPIQETKGNYRILKEGGLLITEDGQKFFNHTTMQGGGPIQAWGYAVYGSSFTNSGKLFYETLCGMAIVAGIDPEDFKAQEIPKSQKYHNTLLHRNHPILSKVRI